MSVSVVVPVFRSENTLGPLCARLAEVLGRMGEPFEVILVEDGGGDGSWEKITQLAASDARVRGFQLSRNFGQHNAMLCGVRQARYATVVTMDDDLQQPPEELPRLISALTPSLDVVYGVPRRMPHGLWRNFTSRITKAAVAAATGVRSIRDISALRAFRTSLREGFKEFNGPDVSIDALLMWSTKRFGIVEFKRRQRDFPRVARRAGDPAYFIRRAF